MLSFSPNAILHTTDPIGLPWYTTIFNTRKDTYLITTMDLLWVQTQTAIRTKVSSLLPTLRDMLPCVSLILSMAK